MRSAQPGKGSRIFLTLFFGLFLAIGLVIFFVTLKEVYRLIDSYSWERISCFIEERAYTRDSSGDEDFVFTVRYRYQKAGSDFFSTQYSTGSSSFSDFEDVQRLLIAYKPDSWVDCFINPRNPQDAILARGSLFGLLLPLVPLIFVAVGGGGIYGIWFWKGGSSRPQPISASASRKGGEKWIVSFIMLVFVLVGAPLTYFFTFKTLVSVWQAQSWPEVSAVVESSRVKSHDSDDGTTYSVDILYSYEFGGESYKSNRYSFISGSSSGYAGKAEIVKQNPPGKQIAVYVNPKDPVIAVIERSWTPELLLGLIPLVFLLVGLGGLCMVWRRTSQKSAMLADQPGVSIREQGQGMLPADLFSSAGSSGKIILSPKSSPVGRFIGITIGAIVWNGIVAGISALIVADSPGGPDAGAIIFLVIFGAVGLALIIGVIHSFLALFNPRVLVELDTPEIRLGSTYTLSWQIGGKSERLAELKISLKGTEEATYRRGTNTHTDREVFFDKEIVSIPTPGSLKMGNAPIGIPTDSMHSFESDNNRILWTLEVRGVIHNWPDVSEDFSLSVMPHKNLGR